MSQQPGARKNGKHRSRWPRWAWWLLTVLVAVLTVFLVFSQRRELEEALHLIARADPSRLAVAAVCEAVSLLCLAAVQRRLLLAGGTRWSLRRWTAIMLGANAMAGAIPGGAAMATAWNYEQLRRRGVEGSLAAAVLAVAGLLSVASLGVLMVLGLFTAGAKGPATLVHPVVGVLIALFLSVSAGLLLVRSPAVRDRVRRSWTGLGRRNGRIERLQKGLAHTVSQVRGLEPGVRPWLPPLGLALLNWLFDVACLLACMWAMDIDPPWHGLLLAFSLAQIPGSLRLTPGSLGVIEASMAALLVLYGMPTGPAIAATLLYRIFSFWLLQPIGWASWLVVSRQKAEEPAAR